MFTPQEIRAWENYFGKRAIDLRREWNWSLVGGAQRLVAKTLMIPNVVA